MIHSDSRAAIEALNSYVIDSKLIWECRKKLHEGKSNKAYIVRVSGHSLLKRNEEANTLTRNEAHHLTGPKHTPKKGIVFGGENLKRSALEKSPENESFQKISSKL